MKGISSSTEKKQNNAYHVKNAITFDFLNEVVKLVLDVDFKKFDPISYACKLNSLKNVDILLFFLSENRPSILKKYNNYASIACNNNNIELLELLIKYQISIDSDAMLNAVKINNIKLATLLIKNKKLISFFNSYSINIACQNDNFKMVKLLLNNFEFNHSKNNIAILFAVENGNLLLIQYLIKHNFHFDENSFILAIKQNNTNIVYLLLKNTRDITLNKDVMCYAINNNNIKMVKLLVIYGCDYDDQTIAFSGKYPEIQELLIKYNNIKSNLRNRVIINKAMKSISL